ncbi:MAG: hypothetical protein ACEPOV_12960 [Hyphomicrobiales bacterium]
MNKNLLSNFITFILIYCAMNSALGQGKDYNYYDIVRNQEEYFDQLGEEIPKGEKVEGLKSYLRFKKFWVS